MNSTRAKRVAALSAGISLLIGAAAPAVAQIQFGPVGEGPAQYNSGYDRSFIKEWQANPPKGYPTLSKANLAPTKAAIARYEEIVAKPGAFRWCPMSNLSPAPSDPVVGVLRQSFDGDRATSPRSRTIRTTSARTSTQP